MPVLVVGLLIAPIASAGTVRGDTILEPTGDVVRARTIGDVAMSADGRRMAFGFNEADWYHSDCDDLPVLGPGSVRVTELVGDRLVQVGQTLDERVLGSRTWQHAVALSADGDRLVVGSPGDGSCVAGAVRVFDWNGGEWTRVPDGGAFSPDGRPGDQLGSSVATADGGNVVAFGAPPSIDSSSSSGFVRVFRWEPVPGRWTQIGEDIDSPSGPFGGMDFGWSIDLSGDGTRLVVGDPAERRLHTYDWDGADWVAAGILDEDLTLWSYDELRLSSDGLRLGARVGDSSAVFEWDGDAWARLGGPSGWLLSGDGELVVTDAADGLLAWDGSSWSALAGAVGPAEIVEMSSDGGRVAVRSERSNGVCSVEVREVPSSGPDPLDCAGPGDEVDRIPFDFVDPAPVAPSETYCVPTRFAVPGDFVLLNITPIGAVHRGHGTVHASGTPAPAVASVNFGPGTVDPNVAITKVGDDGHVCFTNSRHGAVDVVMDQLAVAPADAFRLPTPDGAVRIADTRIGLGGARLRRAETRCLAIDGGDPGEFAAINTTPVGAVTSGNAALHVSGSEPPAIANVNFRPGSIDPNLAIARIGPDGSVCITNSPHGPVDVVLDLFAIGETGTFLDGDAVRLADSRVGLGFDRLGVFESACVSPVGAPAERWIALNATPVGASTRGFGVIHSDDDYLVDPRSILFDRAATISSANVNFRPGSVDPNFALVPMGGDAEICFTNSPHGQVDVVIDQLLVAGQGVFSNQSSTGGFRLADTRARRYVRVDDEPLP